MNASILGLPHGMDSYKYLTWNVLNGDYAFQTLSIQFIFLLVNVFNVKNLFCALTLTTTKYKTVSYSNFPFQNEKNENSQFCICPINLYHIYSESESLMQRHIIRQPIEQTSFLRWASSLCSLRSSPYSITQLIFTWECHPGFPIDHND